MPERADRAGTPTTVGLAVAVLVHAAVLAGLLAVSRAGPPLGPPRDATTTATTEITVGLEGEPPTARVDRPLPRDTPPERGALAGSFARGAERAVIGPSSSATTSGTVAVLSSTNEGPARPSSSGGDGSGGVVPIPLTGAELGLGGSGRNPLLPRTAEAEAPARPAAEQGLRAALRESDRVRGLGPEGPVLRALSEATSMSFAPFNGRAVFDVHTGADGLVWRIDLVDPAGRDGWMDVRRLAVEGLRGKKLKLPSGATAMVMRIEVVSEWKLPDGASSHGEFGVRPGESGTPEMTIPDPSNVGAKPRRVVHTRSIATQVL